MEQLRIRLFGGFEVRRGSAVVSGFATQRATLLFAYLVLNRDRLLHREVLCGQLWGDQPDGAAKKGLRNALWRIRTVIEPEEQQRGTLLQVDGSLVGFRDSGSVWVDAWEFEGCIDLLKQRAIDDGGVDQGTLGRMAHAASLYRGDLLEGHYEEWCLSEQERLRLAYLTLLERLVACHHAKGQWLEAISVGRQLLRIDPLREHIHRAVMECHVAMGDRPSALRQYASCSDSLRRELGIEPMEETRALCETIRQGDRPGPDSSRLGTPGATALGGVVGEVDDALRTLYAVTDRLERIRRGLLRRDTPPPYGLMELRRPRRGRAGSQPRYSDPRSRPPLGSDLPGTG